jgi:hypothetical protein
MSVIDATQAVTGQMAHSSSPFAAANVLGEVSQPSDAETARGPVSLSSPFAEALESPADSEYGAEAEAFELLRAEFEDEDFVEAVSALTDEAAAEHLRAAARWGEGAQATTMATGEVEQWLAGTAERADHLLAELEAHFGDRSAEGELEAEIARVAGPLTATLAEGPLDARELFLGKLVNKAVAVAKGVGRAVAKGVRAVGKLLPLGKLFAVLRRLVRPLLQRVLQKAVGKLPPQLRPLAWTLAGKLGFGPQPARSASPATSTPATPGGPDAAPAPAGTFPGSPPEPAPDAAPDASGVSAEALVDELDARLADTVLAGEGAGAEVWLGELESEVDQAGRAAGEGPFGELDAARDRLARQLLAGAPQGPPLAELEQFIPAVMAAMPLIRLGVKIIGRNRVVAPLAKLVGTLIQPMVGQAAAGQLSRPLASAGLALLGLEAEAAAGDGRLGAEALVATVEDTVREVLELPAETLATELLLESEVQEAFTRAALRHFPARVLRPGLGDDRGVWVLFPRVGTRRRYKRYSIVEPVNVTPPMARSIFLDGETLEDRLLEAGVTAWPVQAEVHHYETLPGATLGHLAAFETPTVPAVEGALEFEDLEAFRPLLASPPPRDHRPGAGRPGANQPGSRAPERGRDLPPGTRLVRLAVPGLRLRRRSLLRVRLGISGPAPVLRLSLHLSERVAHELVRDLEHRRTAQVVARFRTIAGDALRRVLANRLARKLARHAIVLPDGGRERLAENLAEAALRAVAKELPGLASTLTASARAEAPGLTVTFEFRFADRPALVAGVVPEPKVAVHPGGHRD